MSIDREVIVFFGFQINRSLVPEEPENDEELPLLNDLYVDEFKRFNNIISDHGCGYIDYYGYNYDKLAIGISESVQNITFDDDDDVIILKDEQLKMMEVWKIDLKEMCEELGLEIKAFSWHIVLSIF
jgi:hypothetical protein